MEYGFEPAGILIDREQLQYAQLYIQLLREEDLDAVPIFSLHCNLTLEDAAPQVELMLQLYLAGNFLTGEEGKATVPLPERQYRPWHEYRTSD